MEELQKLQRKKEVGKVRGYMGANRILGKLEKRFQKGR